MSGLPFLLMALVFAGLAAGQVAICRHEHRSGQAFVLLGSAPKWARERDPALFRGRLVFHWLLAAVFAAAAVIFLAEFLGIVA